MEPLCSTWLPSLGPGEEPATGSDQQSTDAIAAAVNCGGSSLAAAIEGTDGSGSGEGGGADGGGGPDGGDGGKGGNIIFRVGPNLNTLVNFRNQKYLIAKNGQSGSGNKKTGQDADDLVVMVPKGTVIFDALSEKVIYDCCDEDKDYLAANFSYAF